MKKIKEFTEKFLKYFEPEPEYHDHLIVALIRFLKRDIKIFVSVDEWLNAREPTNSLFGLGEAISSKWQIGGFSNANFLIGNSNKIEENEVPDGLPYYSNFYLSIFNITYINVDKSKLAKLVYYNPKTSKKITLEVSSALRKELLETLIAIQKVKQKSLV